MAEPARVKHLDDYWDRVAARPTRPTPAPRPAVVRARRAQERDAARRRRDDWAGRDIDLGPPMDSPEYTTLVASMVLKLTRAVRDACLGVGPDAELIKARVAVLPDRLNDDGTVTRAADLKGTN